MTTCRHSKTRAARRLSPHACRAVAGSISRPETRTSLSVSVREYPFLSVLRRSPVHGEASGSSPGPPGCLPPDTPVAFIPDWDEIVRSRPAVTAGAAFGNAVAKLKKVNHLVTGGEACHGFSPRGPPFAIPLVAWHWIADSSIATRITGCLPYWYCTLSVHNPPDRRIQSLHHHETKNAEPKPGFRVLLFRFPARWTA